MLKAVISGNVVTGFTGFALADGDDGDMWLKVLPESRLVELKSPEELEAQYGDNAYVRASRAVPEVDRRVSDESESGSDEQSVAVRSVPEDAEPVAGTGNSEGTASPEPASTEGE